MGSHGDSLFLVDALRTEKVRGIGRGLCDFKWKVEDMSVEHGSGPGGVLPTSSGRRVCGQRGE